MTVTPVGSPRKRTTVDTINTINTINTIVHTLTDDKEPPCSKGRL